MSLISFLSCNNGKKYHDVPTYKEEVITSESRIAIIRKFQKNLIASFKDPNTSPLPAGEIRGFKKLDFFPIDTTFTIRAKFIRTPEEKPFLMPTSTSRKTSQLKYGEAHFDLEGVSYSLDIYKNNEALPFGLAAQTLFLPFSDLTNGENTYGGGRYLDLDYPKDGVLLIDFNMAYNPYCAYNPEYSCPLVPAQNHLDVFVKAGVVYQQK